MLEPFQAETLKRVALLTLILGLGTYMFARNFKVSPGSRTRTKLSEALCRTLTSHAIGLMSVFAYRFTTVELAAPSIPESFATTTGRPWLVDLFAVPTSVIFLSIIPAIMATILLFLDKNIATYRQYPCTN